MSHISVDRLHYPGLGYFMSLPQTVLSAVCDRNAFGVGAMCTPYPSARQLNLVGSAVERAEARRGLWFSPLVEALVSVRVAPVVGCVLAASSAFEAVVEEGFESRDARRDDESCVL